jgi:hypothetical protein
LLDDVAHRLLTVACSACQLHSVITGSLARKTVSDFSINVCFEKVTRVYAWSMTSGATAMWRWRVAALVLCMLFVTAFPRGVVASQAVRFDLLFLMQY